MALEDVYYLKKNSIKESYMFYVDSQFRDKNLYQSPSEYAITFDAPFKNVYAIEVLDASIPRTQYSVDKHNNTIALFFNDDLKTLKQVTIPPGDYSDVQLIDVINDQFSQNNIAITIANVSDPGEKESTFRFIGRSTFVLDMEKSTMNTVLGFDEYSKENNNTLYSVHSQNRRYFKSVQSLELDPLKYSSFDAFNQDVVDSTVSSVVQSFDYILNENRGLFQKFIINQESDGVYGYVSQIKIFIGDHNFKLQFSIAIVRQELGNNNELIYEELKLGNTNIIVVEPHQNIGIWNAPQDVIRNFNSGNQEANSNILKPGTYFIFIFDAINLSEKAKPSVALNLSTLSNIPENLGFNVVQNISLNVNDYSTVDSTQIVDNTQNTIYFTIGILNENPEKVLDKSKGDSNYYYSMTDSNQYFGETDITKYKLHDLFTTRKPIEKRNNIEKFSDDSSITEPYTIPISYFVSGNGYDNTESPVIKLLKGYTYYFRYEDNKTKTDFPLGIYENSYGGSSDDLLEGNLTGDLEGIYIAYLENQVMITLSDDVRIKLNANGELEPTELHYMSRENSKYVGNKLQIVDSSDIVEQIDKSLAFTIETNEKPHIVTAPGMYALTGDRYVILRCPEIEQHLYRSRSYERYTMGLAKFKLSNYGYDETRLDFARLPVREFHPIGKLTHMTFRFEKSDGELYNFRGLNHTLTLAIRYYSPIPNDNFTNYELNPAYNPDFFKSIQDQESSDEMSDSDSD